MVAVDIESIRLPTERTVLAELIREAPANARRTMKPDWSAKRLALMARAMKLTESMAPAAYASVSVVRERLGIDDTIELYRHAGNEGNTARLSSGGNPIAVEFLGQYLEELDDGGVTAVIGHEVGHALAHSRDPDLLWAMDVASKRASDAQRAFSIASELTADRFGVLACRDADAILRLEMYSAAGPASSRVRFDTAAYLAQAKQVTEELLSSGKRLRGWSHPEHYVRAYAQWLFMETAEYRELTGDGVGTRELSDVNAILDTLIGKPTARPAPAQPELDPQSFSLPELFTGLCGVAHEKLTEASERVGRSANRAIGSLVGPPILDYVTRVEERKQREAAARAAENSTDEDLDPLEEERRELIARFEELERRQRGD